MLWGWGSGGRKVERGWIQGGNQEVMDMGEFGVSELLFGAEMEPGFGV